MAHKSALLNEIIDKINQDSVAAKFIGQLPHPSITLIILATSVP